MGGIYLNHIRNAVASDASNVGFVHYTCWLDTYKNLFDDYILDSITLRHSVAIFEKEACHNMIVYEDEGHIVAF